MSDIVQRLGRLSASLRIADHPDNRLILYPQPANYYAAMVAEGVAEIERLRAVCGSIGDANSTSRFEWNEDCTLVRTVTTTAWRVP